jgi:hypothetical protein
VGRNQRARDNRLFLYWPIQQRKRDYGARAAADAGKTGVHPADPGPDGGFVVRRRSLTFIPQKLPKKRKPNP